MKYLTALAFVAVFCLAWPLRPSHAQEQICMGRDQMAQTVAEQYNERSVGMGIVDTHVVEMFLSDAGSWTLIIVRVDGLSCLIASGDNWIFVPEDKPSH